MAALNKKCFTKGCICASCEYICSRCFISEQACKNGITYCENKVIKPYEKFIEENNGTGVERLIAKRDYYLTYN